MWQLAEFLNVFNTLTLKQVFRKMKSFFKKLENHFLVERTKIENASFSYKPAISEPRNGPITTNGVLPVTTLFFRKLCFSLRTSYKELIWCTNDPNAHIRTCKRWSFIWRWFFPMSILNTELLKNRKGKHGLRLWTGSGDSR